MKNNIVRFNRGALLRNKKRVVAFVAVAFAGVVVSLAIHSGYAYAVVMTACFAYFCQLWWKAIKTVLKLYK